MARLTWLLRRVRWVGLGLIMAASLGAAVGMLLGGPAFASGATDGSPTEPGTSPTGTGSSNCPSSNPPNQMTLVAGTPQTAILGSAFATGLQVALSNSDGCPVTSAAAGIPVTFSAPAIGASGVFSTSGSNAVTVGADASGAVAAPAFTANTTAGSYTVTASSQYGTVSFSLTNTAAGVPARIVEIPLKSRSASVSSRYPQPLQVRVLDSGGQPGRRDDGHVHARLRRRQRVRHEQFLERHCQLRRRGRPGDRDDRCIRCSGLADFRREQHGRVVDRDRRRLKQRTFRRVEQRTFRRIGQRTFRRVG